MTENGKPVSTAYSDFYDDNSPISEEEEEEGKFPLRKLPQNEVDNAIHAFNSYMNEDDEPLIDYINTSNNYSWVQIRMSIRSFANFADIAMRFLSTATSEASCENAISKQRLIHSNRRLRSSGQLFDAQMILSYA